MRHYTQVLDNDTRKLIAQMTVRPPPGRAALIDQTIRRLKQHWLWQKIDLVYFFSTHSQQAARLNWKNPTGTAITEVNSPSWSALTGYTGNGSSSYLNTGITASSLTQFQQNSAHLAYWCTVNTTGNPAVGLVAGALAAFRSTPRNSSDQRVSRMLAGGGNMTDASVTDARGFVTANRSASNAAQQYINAVATGTQSDASVAPPAENVGFLINVGTQFSPHSVGMATFGSSLNAVEIAALYSIVRRYMIAVGATT